MDGCRWRDDDDDDDDNDDDDDDDDGVSIHAFSGSFIIAIIVKLLPIVVDDVEMFYLLYVSYCN